MRYTRFATLLIFAALVAVGLSACDFSEQNYDIEPGDELEIQGPGEVAVPTDEVSSFYIIPFTIEKEYTWSVEGPTDVTTSTRQDGEYLDITFEEPGNYTVNIESSGQGEEYSGSYAVDVFYPDLTDQAARFGFSELVAAIGTAGLADTLGTDGPFTMLAPTDEALIAAFDTTADGALNTPAPAVLADILQYHVIPASLSFDDISGGQTEATLEGSDVTFNVTDSTRVVDGSPETDDATITDADVPAGNGLIHTIDEVLLPPTASISFADQESTDGETVSVAGVYLPEGGFVVMHDSTSLEDDGPVPSVVGVSDYLESGFHNDVEITLDDPVDDGTVLGAMPHQDTNNNETYDFTTSGGTIDGPYTRDGEAVLLYGAITVPE